MKQNRKDALMKILDENIYKVRTIFSGGRTKNKVPAVSSGQVRDYFNIPKKDIGTKYISGFNSRITEFLKNEKRN